MSNVTDYIDMEIRRTGKFEIKIGKKFPRCALAAATVLASQKILLAFLFAMDLRLLEVFNKTYHPEPACILRVNDFELILERRIRPNRCWQIQQQMLRNCAPAATVSEMS